MLLFAILALEGLGKCAIRVTVFRLMHSFGALTCISGFPSVSPFLMLRKP